MAHTREHVWTSRIRLALGLEILTKAARSIYLFYTSIFVITDCNLTLLAAV